MHYLSFLGGTGTDSTKACWDTLCEPVFLHPVGSAGHVVQSGASGSQNVDALFFTLRWDRYGNHKKHAGTRYVELVFLHLVESTGHSAFRCIRGVKHRCTIFYARVDRYGFYKKHDGSRYAKLVFFYPVGSTSHVVHSGASGA
jgi:hypothetical protein